MIVLLHIMIAIASLALVTYTFFKPTNKALLANYISILATVISGFYLVVVEPTRMLHVCEAGLVYLAITIAATFVARTRLASINESKKSL